MKISIPQIAVVYIFCLALILVLAITGTPDIRHRGVDATINFIPLVDIFTNFYQYMLNILLFVPIGFLLPALWRPFQKWLFTFIAGFVFSLSIEISQLFGSRITDIDDVLMNTAGTIAGYILFLLIKRVFPNIFFSIDGKDYGKWEPYVCFAAAWFVMFFIQPFVVSRLMGMTARFR